jgi:tRNA threonylcarbamoyladenosine biosynthesis protein TsaB
MKILLIDTCGTTGSLALADTSRSPAVIDSATLPGRSAAERLVPTIRFLADNSRITLNQLDTVAVVRGPGSFTGVRVGLSAAKGLCHALNLPLVAISRLAVLASLTKLVIHSQPRAPHSSRPSFDGSGVRVHALLDAGRGEFYSGLYNDGACLRETLITRDQLLAEATHVPFDIASQSREQQPSFVVCEPLVAQSLAAVTPQIVVEPIAADALLLVLIRIQQRAFDDPATIDANYLRRSDAEIFAKPIVAVLPQAHTTRSGTPSR